ncbi:MAG TPA: MBL fold metallo-hydrolase [Bryobacteraceae bacterium]|jgi:L-ascorbate metabolism protein UlaG (beta-lactamase superfamily)|nr:MBL fold metallo-hydrolase [Bryobacteraceae bacterium]
MKPFPKHFNGKHFYNPDAPQVRGLIDLLRWKMTSRAEPSPQFVDDVTPSMPPRRVDGSELRVTFVNHSTVLLQQQNLNILTDPIWSERASPFQSLGPRRHRRPGVRKEDLPPIDVVLLSHNHYDHLDIEMLRWLAGRGDSTFVVPLGLGQFLRSQKIEPVYELDWGESHFFPNATIHAVPALHFAARGLFDRNKTLWCGYVIESQRRIYFAGDTAFGDHFSLIREAFGSPHVALLPIGSYAPKWFMSPVHMGPADAVRAHEILRAETSIAIHHGTFQLGDDAIDTPRHELLAEAIPPSFRVLNNGEFADIS